MERQGCGAKAGEESHRNRLEPEREQQMQVPQKQ